MNGSLTDEVVADLVGEEPLPTLPTKVNGHAVASPIAKASEPWKEPIRFHRKQRLLDEENILRVLKQDPELVGVVAFNEFTEQMMLMRPLPDVPGVVSDRDVPRQWRDTDTTSLTTYLQRKFLPKVSGEKAGAVAYFFARQYAGFHPLRDYLQSVEWDGTPRVARMLLDYFGAHGAAEVYLLAVSQAWMVSAVARVLRPGCKADCMLALEGAQGILKSTGLRKLAVREEWFSDSLPGDLASKDAKDHVRGKWILEMGELAQFKRSEIESVKTFLSRQYEQFRPPYGRNEIVYPRQCVFAGSTNEAEYLVDPTGNRRFWPVKVSHIDIAAIERDRDQLWGEAVRLYHAGARWWLSEDDEELAAAEAAARVTSDPWTAGIARAAAALIEAGSTNVSASEILDHPEFPMRNEVRSSAQAKRVGQILHDLGWKRLKRHMTRGVLYQPPAGTDSPAGGHDA